jgi:hypothetical protein
MINCAIEIENRAAVNIGYYKIEITKLPFVNFAVEPPVNRWKFGASVGRDRLRERRAGRRLI